MNKRRMRTWGISIGVLILLALAATPVLLAHNHIFAAGIGDSGILMNTNNAAPAAQPNANMNTNAQPNTNMNAQPNTNMNNNGGMNQHAPMASGWDKTIQSLNKIEVIGSTAFAIDGKGKTVMVDANPYDVAIYPKGAPTNDADGLRPGDLVVTNFGANQTGTTLIRFSGQKGPGHIFNMADPGTKGPADEAFNGKTGTDWVANLTANNIQVFTSDGRVEKTITDPLFHHPFGQAYNGGMSNSADGSIGAFFTTNSDDASIDRIEIIPSGNGTRFKVTEIGRLGTMGKQTFVAVTWVPSLWIHGKQYNDVLIALDPANNRVAAYPNSSTRMQSMNDHGMTIISNAKQLNAPVGLTINPLNNDILLVNSGDNNLVEVNPAQSTVVATRTLDKVPVDAQTGTGSALFGIAAMTDNHGKLRVFFTDDNTNTLDVLQYD